MTTMTTMTSMTTRTKMTANQVFIVDSCAFSNSCREWHQEYRWIWLWWLLACLFLWAGFPFRWCHSLALEQATVWSTSVHYLQLSRAQRLHGKGFLKSRSGERQQDRQSKSCLTSGTRSLPWLSRWSARTLGCCASGGWRPPCRWSGWRSGWCRQRSAQVQIS